MLLLITALQLLSAQGSEIHTVSSFPLVDYFCTYSQEGQLLWEIPFSAHILSWEKQEDHFLIYSQARDEKNYYLDVFDSDGTFLWSKTIRGPSQ